MKYLSFLFVLIVALTFSCSRKSKFAADNENIPANITEHTSTFTADSGQVANGITYDVVVRNPNHYDTWTTTCLEGLDRNSFINDIFRAVYEGKLKAIDYATEKEMSKDKVRELEKEIHAMRNRIAKIQFTENWYLDTTNMTMQKQVRSMVFGYEIYGDSGVVRGYRPVFRINLNTK